MKLLAALGRVEAIDSLPAVRRTPIDADDPVLNDRATTERHIPSIRQEPPLRRGGRDLFAQRLRLRSRRQRLCLPRRQRAEEIQPRVLQAAPRADEGRHCDALHVKPKCCPNMPARKIARSVNEAARDKARAIVKTKAYVVSRRQRKKVEMLFAISGAPARTERSERRVPSGSRPQSEEAGEVDPFPSTIFATERRHPKGVVAPTRAPTALSSIASSGASGCKGLKVSFV
jgi:hypothetical protein